MGKGSRLSPWNRVFRVQATEDCEYHGVQMVLYTLCDRWLVIDESAEPYALGLPLSQLILPSGVHSDDPIHQMLVEASKQIHLVCVHR